MSKTYRTAEDLYKDFPEIQEIAERIAESEKEADDHNNDRSKKIRDGAENTSTNPLDITAKKEVRQSTRKYPEHALISKICKGRKWENTIYKAKPGRKEFEDRLSHVLMSREPQGIEIKLWNGGRLRHDPVLTRIFWLDQQEEQPESPAENKSLTALSGVELDAKLNEFRDQLSSLNKEEKAGGTGLQIKLLQMNFDAQVREMKYDQEKRDLIRTYEGLLLEKDQVIEELQQDLDDAEDDLNEYEGVLGNAQKEIEKKREMPSIVALGAAIGEKLIIGLATSDAVQSKVENWTGWKKDDQQRLWKEFVAERNSQSGESSETGTDAGFTPASEGLGDDDYKGLSEDHKALAQSCHKVHTIVPEEVMKQIYTFYQFAFNEDGSVNANRMGKVITMMQLIVKDEKQPA